MIRLKFAGLVLLKDLAGRRPRRRVGRRCHRAGLEQPTRRGGQGGGRRAGAALCAAAADGVSLALTPVLLPSAPPQRRHRDASATVCAPPGSHCAPPSPRRRRCPLGSRVAAAVGRPHDAAEVGSMPLICSVSLLFNRKPPESSDRFSEFFNGSNLLFCFVMPASIPNKYRCRTSTTKTAAPGGPATS